VNSADPVKSVLDRLEGVRQTGPTQWEARCPAHDDAKASLCVGRGDDGRALVYCQTGCTLNAVLAKMGLRPADLFAPRAGVGAAPPPANTCTQSRIVATYPYHAADGAVLYEVVRYDPKDFRQRRPDGKGGWVWKLDGAPRVLYRLPQLLATDKGDWVFVVEGEKDADNLVALGLAATCNPGGAGKWKHMADDSALHDRRVAIIADKDPAGLAHAQDVAVRLSGKAAVVKIIDLPDMLAKEDGKPRKDASDWIAWRDTQTTEQLAAALVGMADAAPDWTPTTGMPVRSASAPTTASSPEYRAFPVEVLPEPLCAFTAQAAEAIGCDAAFVALPLLAASASAIGNAMRIELKRGWTEPAIVWAVCVGDSGTLKSPAIERALRPLRQRQHEAMKRHTETAAAYSEALLRYEVDLAAWKRAKGEGSPPEKPAEPILPRCWCDDTTVEALAMLLLQNWRGLLMVRDELAGWLGGFDRYAQGKGGDVARWLEMFGGRSMVVDRKTAITCIYVPRAAMSITGGIQPPTLQRALGRAYFENGLAARLLLAYPPRRAKRWSDREVDVAVEEAVEKMFERLYSLEPVAGPDGEPEPRILRLSPGAKAKWITFYNEHAQEHVDLTGDLSAAWSKLEGYAARLALVVHLVRWAAGDASLAAPDVVDEDSVVAGVTLSRWFGQEARRVYAVLEETEVERQHRELVELVRRHGGGVTARDLMRSSRSYPTSELAELALDGLVKAGAGRWQDAGPTAKGGRPTRRFVLAGAADVDRTPDSFGNSWVSSAQGSVGMGLSPAGEAAAFTGPVDETPDSVRISGVLSTSAPSGAEASLASGPERLGANSEVQHE